MRPGWPRSQGYEPETEGLPASHPAHGVPAGATAGCTNGGRCPIPAKAATSDSYALFSSSATPSQALGLGLCSDGAAYADLWLACLLNAPANAPRRINHSWSSGQTAGAVWAARFSPSSGNVAFDASANRDFSPKVGKSGASEAAEKVPTAVILSEAKDLHLLVFKEILQTLRFAQHERQPFSAACSAPPPQGFPDVCGPRAARSLRPQAARGSGPRYEWSCDFGGAKAPPFRPLQNMVRNPAGSEDFVLFEVCGFSRGVGRTAESQRQRLCYGLAHRPTRGWSGNDPSPVEVIGGPGAHRRSRQAAT